MSSQITAPVSLSRPKIHRLPIAALPPAAKQRSSVRLPRRIVMLALLTVAVVVAVKLHHSVPVLQDGKMQASGGDNGLLSSVSSDAMASMPAQPGKTITLQGKSGAIVGQLARIPAETEQITEIKPISDVDNNAGRELLSIVSKY